MREVVTRTIVVLAIAISYRAAGAPDKAVPAEPFTNSIGMRMLPIPAGAFTMGEVQPVTEEMAGPGLTQHGNDDEIPAHRVTITTPFYLSETEVTAEQFHEFRQSYVAPDIVQPYAGGISWSEATVFCQWLTKKEGKPYRLPSEAEWEYACRAGAQTSFWSGDKPPETDVNRFGLKNMHSKVAEWCTDWYGPYSSESQIDPVGPAYGMSRVVRGGGIEVHPLNKALTEQDVKKEKLGFWGVPYGDFPPFYRRSANRASLMPNSPPPGATPPLQHFIGFRVAMGALPPSKPLPYAVPWPLDGIKQFKPKSADASIQDKPYFKVRPILPIPPENCHDDAMSIAGIPPGVHGHNHSGAIVVCPNGDVFMVSFSSVMGTSESSSDSTMVCTRLRYGAEEWDTPDLFIDLADLNDQSALLWNDNDTLWYFGGGRFFGPGPQLEGNIPFRFCRSTDSGATWSELQVPTITGEVGLFTAQPITSAFRGPDNTLYFGMDGFRADSLLWSSKDNGNTWQDTGGRTSARHTAFVLLKDNRILAIGGKNAGIEGYTPKSYSSDGGLTWTKSAKTPFAALGTNQRPALIRLKSGRLFFASDCQHFSEMPPDGLKMRGVIVALSDDEGETWRTKQLAAATPHERFRAATEVWQPKDGPNHRYPTIGYAVAAQAPDGTIHLMSSMNHPSLHFAMNEAWILSDEKGEVDPHLSQSNDAVTPHEERYPDGALKMKWSSRTDANGRYTLDGEEVWCYPDGKKKYEVKWNRGRKIGAETYWDENGAKQWSWDRNEDGFGVWTRYWPDGSKRTESHWSGARADGPATRWDREGHAVSTITFKGGALQNK